MTEQSPECATPETQGPHDAPPPPSATPSAATPNGSSERAYAAVLHLSTFPFPLLGPLVMWLIQKDTSSFVDHHGREALNFQLTLVAAGFVLCLVSFVTCGLGAIVAVPVGLALAVANIVLTIMAAVRAHEGVRCRYPMTYRLF